MKLPVAILVCSLLGTAGVYAAEPQKRPSDTVKVTDNAVLFREPSDMVEDIRPEEEPEESLMPHAYAEPGASVNISEEFKFDSRQNIDSFLGDYENPYAAPETTYKGSRSEMRNDLDNRPF